MPDCPGAGLETTGTPFARLVRGLGGKAVSEAAPCVARVRPRHEVLHWLTVFAFAARFSSVSQSGVLNDVSDLPRKVRKVSARSLVYLFRLVATAEAISWAGLLVGMYFKYLTQAGELGVKIFGPVHGGIFIAYLLLTILVSRSRGWSVWTTLAGLACSIPPFATLLFERWAQRTGRLTANADPVLGRHPAAHRAGSDP